MKRSITILTLVISVIAPTALFAQSTVEGTGYLPKFEPKSNMKVLEENLKKTGELADLLKNGNDELSEAVKQYKDNRQPDTKARVYNLLGELANKTVTQIDNIVSNKDRMKDGMLEMNYKMAKIKASLDERNNAFSQHDKTIHQEADELKKEMQDLARQIKNDPENQELRFQFRSKLIKLYHLDKRLKTIQAHKRLNTTFGEQLAKIDTFFRDMNQNMDHFVMNLKIQKQSLIEEIKLIQYSAELNDWLLAQTGDSQSAFAMIGKIKDLSSALKQFEVATDAMICMDDMNEIIQTLPDVSDLLGESSGLNLNDLDKMIDTFANMDVTASK